jgi:hypothetical protein
MTWEMLSSAKTIRDGLQTIHVILRDRRITSKQSSADIEFRKTKTSETEKSKNLDIENQNSPQAIPEGDN